MRRMAGESAAAAVIDVTNGDIVALASAPGFEPNSFVFGIRSAEWNALLNDDYRPLANKTITGTYPPGSTFKICMALAALEAGVVSPGDGVGCARLHASSAAGGSTAGSAAATGASTCAAASRSPATATTTRWAAGWGRTGSAPWRTASGSASRHDLPIPAVSAGNMPDAAWKKAKRDEPWTAGDSFNYGIGQGFTLASPMQLALMTARVASGTAVKPRIVRADRRRAGAGRDRRSRSRSRERSICIRSARACARSRTRAPPAARASSTRR